MKISALLLPAICLCLTAMGQSTIPLDSFYVPGSRWTEVVREEYYPCSTGYDIWIKGIVYTIERDTVAGGKVYHLLSSCVKGAYGHTVDCGNHTISNFLNVYTCNAAPDVFAMLRTDSNRVYFILLKQQSTSVVMYSCDTVGKEYLFYDFNLSIGSTVPPSTIASGIAVSAIDSVSLSNGAHVARYNGQLVYGIGAQDGFIHYWNLYRCGPGPSATQFLLCYDNPYFSYQFTYPAGTLVGNLQNDCFDIQHYADVVGVDQVNAPAPATISPNPVHDQLTLMSQGDISAVSVTDITGKTIGIPSLGNVANLYGQTRITIDVSPLPPGVYLLKTNNAAVYRFVKW